MVLNPRVADWSLLGWRNICLVVKPAKPLSWHHTGVIVHSMLGVVNDPAIASVEIFIVLVIFVAIFVLTNQGSCLQVVGPVQMIQRSPEASMGLDNARQLGESVETEKFHQTHDDLKADYKMLCFVSALTKVTIMS